MDLLTNLLGTAMKNLPRPTMRRPGHPLASPTNGRVRVARLILWEASNGEPHPCHWCGCDLTWGTLCADHLDGDTTHNVIENIVPSCRGCNANRERNGTGRIRPKLCARCGELFTPSNPRRLYCSGSCSTAAKWDVRGRGTRAEHGTRVRYVKGKCRCDACKKANTDWWREYNRRRVSSRRCWA